MDMEFVQFIIGTLKDYYPDPLNYILVLEMPWVLNGELDVRVLNTERIGNLVLFQLHLK